MIEHQALQVAEKGGLVRGLVDRAAEGLTAAVVAAIVTSVPFILWISASPVIGMRSCRSW
jgi:hypothetical protein